MYKITAENMSKARGAQVVEQANALAENIIHWAKDEIFEGFYTFYCSPDCTPQQVYDIQGLVYTQNGGASAAVEKLSAEQAEEFE